VLTDGSPVILVFFTLTLCEVSPDSLPPHYARSYPAHSLPAVRLARLAVSRKAQKQRFGELLLTEAVYRSALIADQAGIIGLFVDAKNAAARQFYLRYGFLEISEQPLKLFLPIETIRRAG
jgi:GNAT superfamily N-acetyltransferase